MIHYSFQKVYCYYFIRIFNFFKDHLNNYLLNFKIDSIINLLILLILYYQSLIVNAENSLPIQCYLLRYYYYYCYFIFIIQKVVITTKIINIYSLPLSNYQINSNWH